MNDTIRKIGKVLYYVVVVLVIVLMLNNIIVRSDNIYNIVGFRSYTVLTGSMEPEIMPGDLVIVKSVDNEELEVNDVITFNYEGDRVTHRIVEETDKGFITKGDNNNVEDREVVPSNNIIGKVVTVLPKIGFVIAFLSKPVVMFVSLILLALLILKETFFDSDEDKKKKEEISK